ncbi:hypothetical protein CJ030_MR4G010931 [Morella rubra]|uniref:Uncharacterized protein n=1 Tax=Morella rubra TaxID=262757 RepID=A0A6A1VT42_9ROSI|nr:hypothetical protein CJ030_MR4G010931 [Morella rubra]
MEVTYGRAEFLYMVVVRGLHVDMASFIYQSVCVEALKTDAQISLPYGVLLTQFLHNLMLELDERSWLRGLRSRILDRAPPKDSRDMQPTHEMMGNISSRLAALELKVVSMDAELKKQVSEVQLALKGVATSAELVALTKRVVLLEEHMSDVRADDVMPAGGKHLRCDSSVRAESSLGTLAVSGPSLRDRNELPSPDTASPVGTQSSCAYTFEGSTREIALPKARIGGKLTVHIPDGRTASDDNASSILLSHIGKMKALQLQYESEGKSYTEVEIFCKVLGTKAGYVRVSSVDLSRRLEEARLQIEEMRARQLKYEALLFRYGADDARASADDGGAATEERRRVDADDARAATKKDEEHRKMMEEQQRILVEQQKLRMQLMAEQIGQLQSRSTPKRKFG